jgi:hypothetical protein
MEFDAEISAMSLAPWCFEYWGWFSFSMSIRWKWREKAEMTIDIRSQILGCRLTYMYSLRSWVRSTTRLERTHFVLRAGSTLATDDTPPPMRPEVYPIASSAHCAPHAVAARLAADGSAVADAGDKRWRCSGGSRGRWRGGRPC